MGERQSPERAQEKGDAFQKLAGAVTALDSKSEKRSQVVKRPGAFRGCIRATLALGCSKKRRGWGYIRHLDFDCQYLRMHMA